MIRFAGCRVAKGEGFALLAALCAASPALAQETAAPAKFEITAFDVAGVSILDAGTIERVVYPFAGPDRSSADVEAAQKALQDAYASRGYETVQVDIPPQPEALFAQGIVQLKVTEAPVGKVQVTGSRYHSVAVVQEQVPALQEGKPLNLRELQGQLTEANRFPDRTITPSFKAGEVQGTIDVDLKVKDSLPVHASLELNNDHSPSTKPLRATASVRYSNLWGQGHTIGATYTVAPERRSDSETIAGFYSAPIIGSPWTLLVSGYKSNSNIAALGGTNVLGNGYQVGVRANARIGKGGNTLQSVGFGVDYKNFKQDITVNATLADQAPIEYLPATASYTLSTGDEKTALDLTLAGTFGLRIFSKVGCFRPPTSGACIANDQFQNKVLDGIENFVHLNFDASYTRTLPLDIIAAIRLSAQYADSPLVTNEQFGIGGASSVRGYFQSEAVGDDGYSVSSELRSPSIAPYIAPFIDEWRFFGFVDAGMTRLRATSAEQIATYRLVSTGGGTRIQILDHFTGELSFGVALRDAATTRKGDWRTLFSAKGEF
jgi:hemolysin activation/secretion protein